MTRFCLAFFTLLLGLPAASPAIIHERKQLTIDFTDPKDAAAKATWSVPDKIGVSKGGLGWDGETNNLRDGWIETVPLAVGRSWRPAQSVSLRVTLTSAPKELTLPNGQTLTPFAGSVFVRHSPDGKHWSNWQALTWERPEDDSASGRRFTGLVEVPHRERTEYERLWEEYRKQDVPWVDDEETLTRWIVEREPHFFRDHKPFIGYVQFLWEGPFYGGQRISSFEADVSFALSGWHSPPKDPAAEQDRDGPWRFKAP